MKPKTDIRVKLTGQNGNIFNLLGIALRALRTGGHGELCKPLTEAVTSSKSYSVFSPVRNLEKQGLF